MKVTVVVIAYNHERFIRQALDSILMQQCEFDFEIIVTEDCSTDGTLDIVREYATAHPNMISVLASPVNYCDSRVVQRGFQAARGEYIALLDGDDYWTSNFKLKEQVRFMDAHPEYSICFHYQTYVDIEGRPLQIQEPHGSKLTWSLEEILQGQPIGTGSTLLRHSMLPPLPDWLRLCSYLDFPIVALCMHNGPAGYLDAPLGVYRIHTDGFYSGIDDLTKKLLYQRTFKQVYLHLDPSHQTLVAGLFARRWASIAMKQSSEGQWLVARRTALEGLQDFPYDARLRLLASLPMLYPPLRSMWLAWKKLSGQGTRDEA